MIKAGFYVFLGNDETRDSFFEGKGDRVFHEVRGQLGRENDEEAIGFLGPGGPEPLRRLLRRDVGGLSQDGLQEDGFFGFFLDGGGEGLDEFISGGFPPLWEKNSQAKRWIIGR